MENFSEISKIQGSRHLNLKKSFKLGLRSLLTACSKEEFCKAFPKFTDPEKDGLHRLFIEVISSLHGNIEDQFESLCLETQAGTILDTVEQHVEEQQLDLLFAEKSNIGAIRPSLLEVKKNEIHYLTGILEKAEDQNRLMSSHLDLLKKKKQDVSGVADVVDKLWMDIRSYEIGNNTGS
ncbi:uncharacterized protein [Coffea arabica]|uniref:Uncharacterized protein LOC113703385 n=1 Tax=Coffea arabica TaxID=13443 RepID=A0A6P6TPY9_COFAR|nr:uncharacterized protein LOC113703385 [Coffea arabica]XP_027080529.1 uncharacterized protein LOC113703385 [Coffea arabica]